MLRRGLRYARRIARDSLAAMPHLGARGALYFFLVSPFRELLSGMLRAPYAIPSRMGNRRGFVQDF